MKPIAIPRPIDPELRRQWDEAKRAVMSRSAIYCEHANEVPSRCKCNAACPCRGEMCPIALILDEETRPIWEAAQRAAAEVAAWPAWKHTEQPVDPDCCVGDRSRCRCAPERGGWSDEDVEREKWIAVWNQTEDV